MTSELSLKWLRYFRGNTQRGGHLNWDAAIQLEPATRRALIHTLQRFQLGESGEGRWLKGWASSQSLEYQDAIDLFVAEEQQHSAWMAQLLRKLDAPLLTSHWSDRLFVVMRRAGKLHFELMLFLVAEVMAKNFFGALAKDLSDPLCSGLFQQIVKDEAAHIQFHTETLHDAFAHRGPLRTYFTRRAWKLIMMITMLLVLWDHRAILTAIGCDRRHLWKRTMTGFDVVTAKVFTGWMAPIIAAPGMEWTAE